jgi:hypothetical protein
MAAIRALISAVLIDPSRPVVGLIGRGKEVAVLMVDVSALRGCRRCAVKVVVCLVRWLHRSTLVCLQVTITCDVAHRPMRSLYNTALASATRTVVHHM